MKIYFTVLRVTPKFSRSSFISVAPCNNLFTPRGSPRQDDKLIEFNDGQFSNISLTASNDTDDPHKFKCLCEYEEDQLLMLFKIKQFIIYIP